MSQGWPQALRHEQCVASTIVRFHADAILRPGRLVSPEILRHKRVSPTMTLCDRAQIYSRGALPNLLSAIDLCFPFVVR